MLKTFTKGGVHPEENKLSSDQPIEELPLPEKVFIPFSQHLGAPTEAIVKKGDKVKTGQLIAKNTGFVSANVHASVSGIIEKIDNLFDPSGYKKPCFIIKREGDEWIEDFTDSQNEEPSLSAKEIINKISEAGIVGLGGATFPSHVKLSIPEGKKVDCLIINGVECEPYLTSDHRLMVEENENIIKGIKLLMKGLNVDKAYIGIENNKPDAIAYLSEQTLENENIEIVPLKVKYPQGGEKQLIKAILNREVPSGGLPLDVGTVVFNVGTVYACYEAIYKNKPLIERIVTITGKSLQKPSNFKTRIGTAVGTLIEAAGGLPEDTGKIISGGPMMGKALVSIDTPVVKGCSGILLMKEEESKRKQPLNCIRCGQCVDVCPMCLEPYLLSKMSEKLLCDELEDNKVLDCIECGSCSYTCPANLPLLDFIRLGKSKVIQLKKSRKQ